MCPPDERQSLLRDRFSLSGGNSHLRRGTTVPNTRIYIVQHHQLANNIHFISPRTCAPSCSSSWGPVEQPALLVWAAVATAHAVVVATVHVADAAAAAAGFYHALALQTLASHMQSNNMLESPLTIERHAEIIKWSFTGNTHRNDTQAQTDHAPTFAAIENCTWDGPKATGLKHNLITA